MENLEVENNHPPVVQLEPLEVWHHRELLLVMGHVVFISILFIPIIMLFIFLVKLWVIFLSMVETLVIVSGGLSG